MYGLSQIELLAQEQLIENRKEYRYDQSKLALVLGLWCHNTRSITFTLVVDDFEVKYTNKKDAEHPMSVFKKYHDIAEDCGGKRYLGIRMRLDYKGKESTWPCLNTLRDTQGILFISSQ
jgi:hypothetical protein